MLFGLCRLMQWSHCIFCVPNRLVFFFASLAFEVISFNACISAMEKTVRWTQALVLLRHLPGALRTNSNCSQLQGFRDASDEDSATPFHNLVDEAPFQHRR